MGGRKIRSTVIALAVAAALTPLAPAFGAQNQKTGNQEPATAQQKQSQQKPRTYFGRVVKLQKGNYALMIDSTNKRGYYLDDQKDAMKYDQKQVLVTGTVDTQTSTLHVLTIKPVSE